MGKVTDHTSRTGRTKGRDQQPSLRTARPLESVLIDNRVIVNKNRSSLTHGIGDLTGDQADVGPTCATGFGDLEPIGGPGNHLLVEEVNWNISPTITTPAKARQCPAKDERRELPENGAAQQDHNDHHGKTERGANVGTRRKDEKSQN